MKTLKVLAVIITMSAILIYFSKPVHTPENTASISKCVECHKPDRGGRTGPKSLHGLY